MTISPTESAPPLATDLDPLLSKKQASAQIGISVRTLERAIAAGAIRPVKVATRVLIRTSDIETIQREGLTVSA